MVQFAELFQVLDHELLIHSIEYHVLLNLLHLSELAGQVLIGCVELEKGLKVHLGALFEEVGSNEPIHVHAILLFLLTTLAKYLLRRLLLEVFELELFFLDELSFVSCGRKFVLVGIWLFLDVLCGAVRVFRLALVLGDQVGLLQGIVVPGCPLLVIFVKP